MGVGASRPPPAAMLAGEGRGKLGAPNRLAGQAPRGGVAALDMLLDRRDAGGVDVPGLDRRAAVAAGIDRAGVVPGLVPAAEGVKSATLSP